MKQRERPSLPFRCQLIDAALGTMTVFLIDTSSLSGLALEALLLTACFEAIA